MTSAIEMPVHVTPAPPEVLRITPGIPAAIRVSVFNTSEIIDAFVVALVGADERWVTASPSEVRLFPDSAGAVDLSVTVPTDFPAGVHELTVRVTSQTSGLVVAASPVTLEIAEAPMADIRLDPEHVVAGRTGRFGVVVTNTGNVPIDLDMSADDKTNELNYEITPHHQVLQPKQTGLSQVVVTGPRPLSGVPAARPFVVTAEGDGLSYDLQATFVSEPWIPRWVLTFLSIALLLGLWAFVVGLAIDAIIDDQNDDLSAAFADGMESVVGAINPDALNGAEQDSLQTPDPATAVLADAGVVEDTTIAGMMATGVDGAAIPGATIVAVPVVPVDPDDTTVAQAAQTTDPPPMVKPDATRDQVTTTVEEDGSFVFEDMENGDYLLVASAPGFVTPEIPGPDDVYQCPAPGSSDPPCVGIPLDPAVDAAAIAAGTGDATPAFTLVLDGEPGLISGVVLSGGEPQDAVVTVTRLVDPEGAALPELLPAAVQQTDADGRFAIDDLETPSSYEVTVTAAGFVTQYQVVPLAAGQRVLELEIPLTPTGLGTVSGTATNAATGTALGGVAVEIRNASGTYSVSATTLTTTTEAGAIGTYEITGVPIGEYVAVFKAAGYDDHATPFAVSAAEQAPIVNGPMIPSAGAGGFPIGTVTGTVTDALTGEGLSGVTITVSGPGATLQSSTLSGDQAGSYSVAGLPIGTYTVAFSAPNYQQAATSFSITVDVPEPNVPMPLDIIPTPVSGTVLVAGGPADDATVGPQAGIPVLFDPTPADPDDDLLTLGSTDATGAYAVSVPAQPGVRELIFAGDFLVTTISLAIDPGTAVDAGETTLIPFFDFSVSLMDEFGRPFADVVGLHDPPLTGEAAIDITDVTAAKSLFAIKPSGPEYQTTLPLEGTATFTDLPGPGTYTFAITMPGDTPQFVAGVTTMSAVDEFTPEAAFAIPFAAGVVWGSFTEGGVPIAEEQMRLVRVVLDPEATLGYVEVPNGVIATELTDADGRASFGPLTSPETFIVKVFRPGAPDLVCGAPIELTDLTASLALDMRECS